MLHTLTLGVMAVQTKTGKLRHPRLELPMKIGCVLNLGELSTTLRTIENATRSCQSHSYGLAKVKLFQLQTDWQRESCYYF